ncbi:MAG: MazG family protein [Oscillospiraceae bacterium]|nr:MazG family protein [Oscillospiraceae bacterium]
MINFMSKEHYDFEDLRALVAFLRSENGCPWDRVQTHASIRRNFLEEAYEAVEGMDRDDPALMQEEFGDVLLQVVFHTNIEEDAGRFTMEDVCDTVCKKLIFRHPHLFAHMDTADWDWEEMKRQEKGMTTQSQVLDGVARTLPALIRGDKLSGKMGKMNLGFSSPQEALDTAKASLENCPTEDSLGKALFSLAATCKLMDLDPEQILHNYCEKIVQKATVAEEQGRLNEIGIQQFLSSEEN